MRRISAGRLFHTDGRETENARCPNEVRVRTVMAALVDDDLGRLSGQPVSILVTSSLCIRKDVSSISVLTRNGNCSYGTEEQQW